MLRRRLTSLSLATMASLCLALFGADVRAQARATTIIVPFGPGGNLDLNARLIARLVQPHFSEPWVVVNRPGASAAIGRTALYRARPDSRTIMVDSGAFMLQGALGTVPWKGATDFEQIGIVMASYSVHFVRADAPWKTMTELVEYSRKNPGKVNYGVTGPNTVGTIRYLMLRQATGISWTEISYNSDAPAITALLGGHIETAAAAVAAVTPLARAGKVRILAVPASERVPTMPDIPTFQEMGYPVILPSLNVVLGPKGMPADVVQSMSSAIEQATATAEYRKFVEDAGAVLYTRFDAQMKAVMADEEARYHKVAPVLLEHMKANSSK